MRFVCLPIEIHHLVLSYLDPASISHYSCLNRELHDHTNNQIVAPLYLEWLRLKTASNVAQLQNELGVVHSLRNKNPFSIALGKQQELIEHIIPWKIKLLDFWNSIDRIDILKIDCLLLKKCLENELMKFHAGHSGVIIDKIHALTTITQFADTESDASSLLQLKLVGRKMLTVHQKWKKICELLNAHFSLIDQFSRKLDCPSHMQPTALIAIQKLKSMPFIISNLIQDFSLAQKLNKPEITQMLLTNINEWSSDYAKKTMICDCLQYAAENPVYKLNFNWPHVPLIGVEKQIWFQLPLFIMVRDELCTLFQPLLGDLLNALNVCTIESNDQESKPLSYFLLHLFMHYNPVGYEEQDEIQLEGNKANLLKTIISTVKPLQVPQEFIYYMLHRHDVLLWIKQEYELISEHGFIADWINLCPSFDNMRYIEFIFTNFEPDMVLQYDKLFKQRIPEAHILINLLTELVGQQKLELCEMRKWMELLDMKLTSKEVIMLLNSQEQPFVSIPIESFCATMGLHKSTELSTEMLNHLFTILPQKYKYGVGRNTYNSKTIAHILDFLIEFGSDPMVLLNYTDVWLPSSIHLDQEMPLLEAVIRVVHQHKINLNFLFTGKENDWKQTLQNLLFDWLRIRVRRAKNSLEQDRDVQERAKTADFMDMLIFASGLDCSEKHLGETPLIAFVNSISEDAEESYVLKVLDILVQNGCPLEALDKEGLTALYRLCLSRLRTKTMKSAIEKMIQGYGADINAKNRNGQTILQYLTFESKRRTPHAYVYEFRLGHLQTFVSKLQQMSSK